VRRGKGKKKVQQKDPIRWREQNEVLSGNVEYQMKGERERAVVTITTPGAHMLEKHGLKQERPETNQKQFWKKVRRKRRVKEEPPRRKGGEPSR